MLPNFLIIGAAKSGTTALYAYLKQHPQVFMSARKEAHFFSFEGKSARTSGPGDVVGNAIASLNEYKALFSDVTTEVAIGEASPTYIYLPHARERILHHVPNAKLIAILRQPAERAFSAYMHVRRDRREPVEDFRVALSLEEQRVAENWGPIWHYKNGGYYYEQLQPYFQQFPREQIKVIIYEEFKKNPSKILAEVFGFLNVEPGFVPDISFKPNVSGLQKSRAFQSVIDTVFMRRNPLRYLSRIMFSEKYRLIITSKVRQLNLEKLRLSDDIWQDLTSCYSHDIGKLELLLERDLSIWRKR